MKLQTEQIIGVIGVSLLIILSPWAYGGVRAEHQQWLILISLLTYVPCAIVLVGRSRLSNRGRIPLATLPLLCALLLAVAQTIPLSPEWLEALSPNAAQWYLESPAIQGTVQDLAASHHPVSLFPASTLRDLAILGLPVSAFVFCSLTMTTRFSQMAICTVAAVNGALFAAFGIVQQLTFNGKLYWTVPLSQGGNPFAAFVNRNHAGGYLNLCVAAALMILIWNLIRIQGDDPDDFAAAYELGGPFQRWTRSIAANLNPTALLTISMAVLAAAGVVCSLSRGAILSLILATCIGGLSAMRARKSRSVAAVAGLILVIGIVMAAWLGRGELLRERLAETVADIETDGSSRIDHWQDVIAVCRDYWISGTGLGTYRYAYRPYETQLYTGWFYHAENQYLEALVEGGITGLAMILLAIGLVTLACVQLLRRAVDPRAFAMGTAGLFAVMTQATHAMFDFGLYMPANAILFASLAGLCCAQVPRRTRRMTCGWSPQDG